MTHNNHITPQKIGKKEHYIRTYHERDYQDLFSLNVRSSMVGTDDSKGFKIALKAAKKVILAVNRVDGIIGSLFLFQRSLG